jgi:alkylation response protein AidB-like acyl-CoA dehydrogenase
MSAPALPAACISALAKLKVIAAKVHKNGQPLNQDPLFAARMARVEIDLENMKTTNLRVIAAVAGGGVPGAESSMLKIRGTEIRQEILSLIRRAMGVYAVPYIDEAQYEGYDRARGRHRRSRHGLGQLLQLPQAVDLRWLQRNPEEHHLQDDSGLVNVPDCKGDDREMPEKE